ncbi:MAG TPA: beta-ketoacyl synthase N-terminal-like domain-containing protein [Dehalococcoidia bacterium]
MQIRHPASSVVVVGGVDTWVTPASIAGFCLLRALSTRSPEEADRASRPFDLNRDGLVAILRFAQRGKIDEHAVAWDIDVICLEGAGMTSVAGEAAPISAGMSAGRRGSNTVCGRKRAG